MRLRSPLVFSLALALVAPGSAVSASGGAAYGDTGSLPYSSSSHPGSAGGSGRPVLRSFSVPARAQTGAPVVLRYRVDAAAPTVRVRLTAVRAGEHRPAYNLNLGNHRTGRTVRYRWAAAPAPGRYTLLLHVVDPSGMRLAQTSRASARAALRVVAAPAPASSSPPAPESGPAPVVTPPAPAVTPAGLPGVFPARGPHGFGGG